MKKSAIASYLERELHTDVLNRYADQKKMAVKKYKANRLEYYFNRIVTASQMSRSQGMNKFFHDSFVDELFGSNEYGLNQLKQLFNYDLNGSWQQAGQQFEYDLLKTIEIAAKTSGWALGEKKTITDMNWLGKELQGIPVRALDHFNSELNNWIQYEYGKEVSRVDNGLYRLAGVYGKIDLKAPSQIKIAANASPMVKEFLNLLQDANISAKNYAKASAVKLGNTNYFRVVSSVLSDLGAPHSDKNNILEVYRHTKNPKDNTMALHRYHLRYVYELIGPGQFYIGQDGKRYSLGTVDYLIIFEKSSGKIIVKSTLELIYNNLTSGKYYKTIMAFPQSLT